MLMNEVELFLIDYCIMGMCPYAHRQADSSHPSLAGSFLNESAADWPLIELLMDFC